VTTDPLALMNEVARATDRMLETAATLDDAGVAAPSALPGWTRGHVLTHLARNADGMGNLLHWARTGIVTPQYPSPAKREADIATGAPRGAAEQFADVRDSAARYADAAADLTPEQWMTVLDIPGAPQTAAFGVWRRLREVEVHHADLDAGYGIGDWPASFSHRLLHEIVTGYGRRDDAPALTLHPDETGHPLRIGAGGPVVSGPAYALAGWLTGRSPGDGLTVAPTGPLPAMPDWM
jgi:maleylpyruvate isomerase